MLRIAVPNKGALGDPAKTMLQEAGYLRANISRELVVHDPVNDIDFFFLRPRDVAIYVGAGKLDLGITGKDMLLDSGAKAKAVLGLGFAPSTFRLAVPEADAAAGVKTIKDLSGKRIATSYVGLLNERLAGAGVEAEVIKLDGAVENSVALGVADAVADVVDTGATLRKAGLVVIDEPLLESEALLIAPEAADEGNGEVETFVRRIEGVIAARKYVLVDYDIPVDLVEKATAITPGFESPTVSSLQDASWAAVRAMVPKADLHPVMDDLYALGARGILVTDILATRL
ncbi:MAG: ATP phosphoribosyltransferase [Candidatus Nanopelagicales bacterium]